MVWECSEEQKKFYFFGDKLSIFCCELVLEIVIKDTFRVADGFNTGFGWGNEFGLDGLSFADSGCHFLLFNFQGMYEFFSLELGVVMFLFVGEAVETGYVLE